MGLSARAIAVLVALTALSGFLFAALLGGPRTTPARATPVLGSTNVDLIASVPGTAAISGVFSRSAPYFYVSGLDSVSVLDVSDPRAPRPVGKLANAIFENEAMTLGERTLADGTVQRFLLVGNDLGQASVGPDGYAIGRIGGRELIIVDVTDPARPRIAGRTPSTGPDAATTSTHTVACVNAACTVAYSAGDEDGEFSIFDLSDITAPRQVATVRSPAAGEGPIGQAGHHWNVDGAGVAWHTGSGGTAAFDIADPLHPQLLNGTDEHGTASPYNDFIHHNSQRPNARAFGSSSDYSVANGNVVLVTEEDYANEGDEVVCSRAGTLQTWALPSLDGAAYRAGNPDAAPDRGTMTPLDTINPPAESGGGLSSPVGAFCSAHWFDYHQSGVVAQGYYQQGLRLVDVRDARDLKQFGYFTGGVTEVWDAYWAPERDAAGVVVPGRKTNLVYTVDAVRGVDVFEVSDLPPDLPVAGDDGARGTFPAAPGAAPAGSSTPAAPAAPSARSTAATRSTAASTLAGAAACTPPRATVTRTTGRTVRGTARAGRGGCRVALVRVTVARRVSARCRFLTARGTLTAVRSCRKPVELTARGTTRWSVTLPARGRYVVSARAVDTSGAATRTAATRRVTVR